MRWKSIITLHFCSDLFREGFGNIYQNLFLFSPILLYFNMEPDRQRPVTGASNMRDRNVLFREGHCCRLYAFVFDYVTFISCLCESRQR